jgi:hypothetical protein
MIQRMNRVRAIVGEWLIIPIAIPKRETTSPSDIRTSDLSHPLNVNKTPSVKIATPIVPRIPNFSNISFLWLKVIRAKKTRPYSTNIGEYRQTPPPTRFRFSHAKPAEALLLEVVI